jgi:hypothetical protein
VRLLLALLLLAFPANAAERPLAEFTANPIPETQVALKRGTVPVRISLGFDRAMLLNLAPARATGLKPFPIIGKFTVRNPQIPGGEAVIRGNLITADVAGTGNQRLPTAWIDKDVVVPPNQGVVSALAIRADRVRFSVPNAPAGGRLHRLPRAGRGDAHIRWQVGDTTIRVVLDFTTDRSILNARAARALEAEGLVRRTGRIALWSPFPALALPIELLEPAAGATMMGLPLLRPTARITPERAKELDARTASGIEGAAVEDEDAIVVTADRDGPRRRGTPWMLIGRDVLGYCGTVELDRPGAAWELTCAFPA